MLVRTAVGGLLVEFMLRWDFASGWGLSSAGFGWTLGPLLMALKVIPSLWRKKLEIVPK